MTARLGAVGVALAVALIGGSEASSRPSACAYPPGERLGAGSRVVFDAVALRGPSFHGELLSPARFRVRHYRAGSGPPVIPVRTAMRKIGRDRYVRVGEGIAPRAGELWRIYGSRGRNGVVQASFCSGSARLAR